MRNQLLQKFLLIAIGTLFIQASWGHSLQAATIELKTTAHFLTPGGDDVVLTPGTYLVSPGEEWIRVIPAKGRANEAILLEARSTNHDQDLKAPVAVTMKNKDELILAVLLPGKVGLEVVGSQSGIRSRAAYLSRKRYSYQKSAGKWTRASAPKVAQAPQRIKSTAPSSMSAPSGAPKDCNKTVTLNPKVSVYPLIKHIWGNSNIKNGRTSYVTIHVYIRQTPLRLMTGGFVWVHEAATKHTQFQRDFSSILYDAAASDPGCQIDTTHFKDRYTVEQSATYTYLMFRQDVMGSLHKSYKGKGHTDFKHYSVPRYKEGRTGILDYAKCILNYPGDDTNRLGCRIQLFPIKVALKAIEPNCSSSFRVQPFPTLLFPLRHQSGDDDIHGNDRTITIDNNGKPIVQMFSNNRAGKLSGNLTVREVKGDHTTFTGRFYQSFLQSRDLPPHCEIESVKIRPTILSKNRAPENSAPSIQVKTAKYNRGKYWFSLSPEKNAVFEMKCLTDTKGGDSGQLGCRIFWYPLQVTLKNK